MAGNPDAELLASLGGQVERCLAEVLPGDEPVALVSFPNHANAGDPAIWLAAERTLARLGKRVAYRCAWSSYDPRALRAAAPEGPILLNGGGNLGDLYAGQQGTRERVLADFPGRHVVQLPQSIWFEDPANLERNRALFEGHGAVTLLVREGASLERARESFDVPVRRCPDLVFALHPLDRPVEPDVPVVWLARHDPETARPDGGAGPEAGGLDLTGVRRLDWLDPVPGEARPPLGARLAVRAQRLLGADRPVAGPTRARLLARTFDPLARHWLDRGRRILSGGEVVITDRLHGHVLSLLMGIPHVVTDNRTGKVRAVWEADTHGSHLARWADTPAEALELARSLTGAAGAAGAAGTAGTPGSAGAAA